MGLETATYISQLVVTNPVGATDDRSTTDDHLRLIKATIKNSFPGITGAMTATQAQLNLNVGNTETIRDKLVQFSLSISGVGTRLDSMSASVALVQADVARISTTVATLWSAHTATSNTVSVMAVGITAISNTVSVMAVRINTLSATVATVQADVARISTTVATAVADIARISQTVSVAVADIARISQTVSVAIAALATKLSADIGTDGVGVFAMLKVQTTTVTAGATTASTNLRYIYFEPDSADDETKVSSAPSAGTWRNLSGVNLLAGFGGMFQRIS